jgi:5-methylcytosine-specific restriction protein A
MSFVSSFSIGSVVGNTDIVNEFKCGNMGGMRHSKQTKTLVIISDHTKDLYEDKWYGEIRRSRNSFHAKQDA